jgi:hypothetical protein
VLVDVADRPVMLAPRGEPAAAAAALVRVRLVGDPDTEAAQPDRAISAGIIVRPGIEVVDESHVLRAVLLRRGR